MVNERFIVYEDNKIVDCKLMKSWIIRSGDVGLLCSLLNNNSTVSSVSGVGGCGDGCDFVDDFKHSLEDYNRLKNQPSTFIPDNYEKWMK